MKIKKLPKLLFLTVLLNALNSCQLDQEITKIRDNIKKTVMPSSNEKYAVKTDKKNTQGEENIIVSKNETSNIKEDLLQEEYSFVQPKIDNKFLKELKKRNFEDVQKKIGLLIPMTGNKDYVGKFVTNSVRLKLSDSAYRKEFEVYDTKSTIEGTKSAFRNASSKGIKLIIGPVFSDTTLALSELKISNDINIFSLSNNENIFSKNIIITGPSIKNEFDCIFKFLENQDIKNLAIIQHKRPSTEKLNGIVGELNSDISKEFITFPEGSNIEQILKSHLKYEERRELLDKEIENIKNSELDEENKELEIKKLSVLETFGPVPFDAIIINETGNRLLEIMSILAYYDINSTNTNIIGTSIWDGFENYKENIFEGTFFVSSKSRKKDDYDLVYLKNFKIQPNNLNYLTNDILQYIEELQRKKINPLKLKFSGILGDTKLNASNSFKREYFLKTYKKQKIVPIGSCKNQNKDI